jgi:prepilin peptidase CpaA
MIEAAILVIFPFCMVHAALSDAVSMTIANRLSLILTGSFVLLAPLTGMEWATFAWHLAAGALVLSVTFSMFAIGAMGGGDAKLLSATALWMGFGFLLVKYLVYGAMLGGLLTLAILAFRASPVSWYAGRNMFLRHFADQKAGVPYGVALGLAGLLVFPETAPMQWVLEQLAR